MRPTRILAATLAAATLTAGPALAHNEGREGFEGEDHDHVIAVCDDAGNVGVADPRNVPDGYHECSEAELEQARDDQPAPKQPEPGEGMPPPVDSSTGEGTPPPVDSSTKRFEPRRQPAQQVTRPVVPATPAVKPAPDIQPVKASGPGASQRKAARVVRHAHPASVVAIPVNDRIALPEVEPYELVDEVAFPPVETLDDLGWIVVMAALGTAAAAFGIRWYVSAV